MTDSKESQKNGKNRSYVVCGLLSGVITKTICAPFDRIRLLYQVQPMFNQFSSSYGADAANNNVSGKPNVSNGVNVNQMDKTANVLKSGKSSSNVKYNGVIKTAKKIIREEGLKGLWRGNVANTIRGGLCYATKFGINDTAREYLKSCSTLQMWFNKRKMNSVDGKYVGGQNDFILSLLAGASAGLVQKSLTYPLDLISVRMALGINTRSLSKSCKYTGLIDCLSTILRTEGLYGLYKGFTPSMCTGVPYVALQMAFFEFYRKNLFNSIIEKDNLSIKQVAFVSSISGSAAGASALLLVFPGDTVRKRMMNNAISSESKLYKDSKYCIRYILRNEGISAFYHGLFPSLLKSLPSGAIQFVMYEILKHLFKSI
ncbi:mitochondrial carrier protein, putative [Theileria equi strain WA]|uniref:Mitochondrial carrier protein, putative n=1 Tax=Theileria equi strain WA TaxID=1537102 RepID=L1LBS8_THEEQ|nr:mitochondrial carrier protein, putative [Theileria equi strain WA]EKX72892.1 mitochondrial carrier protein, putative [Theileria equi strain WA]|eukprot:XP_004832344.1 mitochondrial carrier protein, putative [Theileria equi strain WA]